MGSAASGSTPLSDERNPHDHQPASRSQVSDTAGRVAAAIGAVAFLPFGAWAMVAPRSFFDAVATFHPYNQHLVQDIGAFQLGLGVVLLIAALRPTTDALGVALVGCGIGAAAHVVSHVIGHDLGGKPATDIPTFTLVAVILLAAGARRLRRHAL